MKEHLIASKARVIKEIQEIEQQHGKIDKLK